MIHESDSSWIFLTKFLALLLIHWHWIIFLALPQTKKMFSQMSWASEIQCLALAIGMLSDTHGFLIHCSLYGAEKTPQKTLSLRWNSTTSRWSVDVVHDSLLVKKYSKRLLVSKIYSPNLRSSRCLGTLRELPNHSWDQPSASLALGWD